MWCREYEYATGLEYTIYLIERGPLIFEMFDNFTEDDDIEEIILERRLLDAAGRERDVRVPFFSDTDELFVRIDPVCFIAALLEIASVISKRATRIEKAMRT